MIQLTDGRTIFEPGDRVQDTARSYMNGLGTVREVSFRYTIDWDSKYTGLYRSEHGVEAAPKPEEMCWHCHIERRMGWQIMCEGCAKSAIAEWEKAIQRSGLPTLNIR